ncbi:MAG: response regulator, partial [Desulfobacterales bacterium]|nr:response regulator [Desulfobacterales bacterium]
MKLIKVLVADDSALMRRSLKEILESSREIEVIGTARDGEDVLQKAAELKPDVITLDINMPKMDGITALKQIIKKEIAPVIMVSSLTQENAQITFDALEIGAFDYVAKPGGTVSSNIKEVTRDLIRKVKAASGIGVVKRLSRKSIAEPQPISKTIYKSGIVSNKFSYKAI